MIESILLFAVGAFSRAPNLYREQWRAGMIFAVAVIAVKICRKYGPLVATTWFYFAAFAAYLSPDPLLGGSATETLFAYILLPVLLVVVKPNDLWKGLQAVALFSAIRVLFKSPGVMDNAATDGTFLACVYPALLLKEETYAMRNNGELKVSFLKFTFDVLCVVIIPFSIFVAGGSVGIGCLAVTFALLAFAKIPSLPRRIAVSTAIVVVFGGLGAWLLGNRFLDDNGRIPMWSLAMEFFHSEANPFFGFGPGSFIQLMPRVQMAMGRKGGFDLWLHSDWLQTYFEAGMIGLGLTLAVFAKAVYLSRKRLWLFLSLISYGLAALAQFPNRLFLFALYGVLLLHWSYSHDDKR